MDEQDCCCPAECRPALLAAAGGLAWSKCTCSRGFAHCCQPSLQLRIAGAELTAVQALGSSAALLVLAYAVWLERLAIKKAARSSRLWVVASILDLLEAAFSLNLNPLR